MRQRKHVVMLIVGQLLMLTSVLPALAADASLIPTDPRCEGW
jgi:hypothetical protein